MESSFFFSPHPHSQDSVSQCIPDCYGTHTVDQIGIYMPLPPESPECWYLRLEPTWLALSYFFLKVGVGYGIILSSNRFYQFQFFTIFKLFLCLSVADGTLNGVLFCSWSLVLP